MSKYIQAIRGMHDILPEAVATWHRIEDTARSILAGYGYAEIRTPILEVTDLFKRSIGEVTDIVEKEMYSFEDRNGDSLSLRPEGTASCVRAAIEHGLLVQPQRLWYRGPMFRHERPQRGRYRQFNQIGAEVFGLAGPDIDLELILLTARLWRTLGLNGLRLEINSLGDPEERRLYREQLVTYLDARREHLDAESLRRLHTNPLRVLDSKHPETQKVVADAPTLMDHLGEESLAHFHGIRHGLDQAGISYRLNPRLVRGLDYYNRTVFEWITEDLGAQGTVCAGGRYDGSGRAARRTSDTGRRLCLGARAIGRAAWRSPVMPASLRCMPTWSRSAIRPRARPRFWPSACATPCRGCASCPTAAAAASRASSRRPTGAERPTHSSSASPSWRRVASASSPCGTRAASRSSGSTIWSTS